MQPIETRKYYIISQIMQFNNEHMIDLVENFIKTLSIQSQFPDIFKPMQKTMDVETMKIRQNYSGFNKNQFKAQVKELNVKESLSELLAIV